MQNRFYTRRIIRVTKLAEIPTLFMIGEDQ